MIGAQIIDGADGRGAAKVSDQGELIVRPYDYDLVQYKELAVDATGYTFFEPKAANRFVITGIYLKADRQVSNATDADVIIYEADENGSATVDKVLFETAMIQGEQVLLTNIRVLVNKGKYINGKTSDDDVHATLFGYYIPLSDRTD